MHKIQLYYGPYGSNGIIRHRPQKLRGVIDCLKKLGFDVELIKIPCLERVVVKIKGYVIVSCNITLLLFNMPCDEDPTCIKFLEIVKDAEKKLYDPKNIKNFADIKEGVRYLTKLNSAKTTRDLFSNPSMLWFEIPASYNADYHVET